MRDQELVESAIDALAEQQRRILFVEHAKVRIQPGGDGVLLQQPGTKAVHGGDEGALDPGPIFRIIRKLAGQAALDFVRRALRESDRQDTIGSDPLLRNEPAEPLHQDAGFPTARPCHHADIGAGVRRGLLLRAGQSHSDSSEAAASPAACSLTRQIVRIAQ